MSCKKAWAALQERQAEIVAEVNAGKDAIGGEAVWNLLKEADRLVVASGRKTLSYEPVEAKEEILAKACGRTGNLRAPTLRIGTTYYVGFNEELYRDYLS